MTIALTTCHYCPTPLDPETDWAIYDTPVGSYELIVCDDHLEDHPPMGAVTAVKLCLSHPVVHEG